MSHAEPQNQKLESAQHDAVIAATPTAPLSPGEEFILDDIVDLEEYARLGKQPPLARGYRFKVNGEPFVIPQPIITGREVLTLAGFLPPENYRLRLTVAGHPDKVGLDQKIDLRRPGVEKFKVLPRDQTEG